MRNRQNERKVMSVLAQTLNQIASKPRRRAVVQEAALPALADCGPGESPQGSAGTVLCHHTDRWGTHALVLMETGETEHCHGLTDVGIGWYLLKPQPVATDGWDG